LQAKYHGPYTVLEQLGSVDYVIATPDRRKTKRVCHINLLKQYHVRDASLCPPVDTAVSDYVGIADSVESDALTPREPRLSEAQNFELTSLISEFVRRKMSCFPVTHGFVTSFGFLRWHYKCVVYFGYLWFDH